MIKFQHILSIILFFPVLLIQITVIPLISIGGVIPDLLIILLVYYGITQGQIYGSVLGFIYGFLFDIITGSLLGSTMISKTIVGFTAGYFSSENKIDNYLVSYNFALIVLLCAFIDSTINTFFTAIDFNTSLLILLFEHSVLPAIYTSTIGLMIMIFYPKRRNF
jgi:rod shape-determining protein MreD